MNKIVRLQNAFRNSVKPPPDLSASDWAHDRVAILDGKSPFYDKYATPWFIEPLDSTSDPEVTDLVVVAPIGSGKTTMLEAAMCNWLLNDPGPTLTVNATDDAVEEWFSGRLMYSFTNTKETSILIPTGKNRHKTKKNEIQFPGMSLYSTGAKISGLQARSMRRVLCDEPWLYKKGMIKESEGRLHDRWNRLWMGIAQGGFVDDDWHKKWMSVNQYEYMFTCPKCLTEQPYTWGCVNYDETLESPLKQAETAHIKCLNPNCDHIIPDNPVIRREIATNSRYVKVKDGLPGSKGYHFNVLCNFHVPLWRIVLQRIEAMEEVKKGNLVPLRQMIQKRLAEFWDDSQEDERVNIVGAGYSFKDYANGEKWEDEHVRFMTVDRQQAKMYWLVRAWAIDGRSRLIGWGEVETFEDLERERMRFNVSPNKLQIDCGYMQGEVFLQAAKYGWLCLRGDQRNEFAHRTPGKNTIYKPYSPYQPTQASNGKKTHWAFFSNLVFKDMLYQLRNGKGLAWEVPDDIDPEYLRQLDSEKRRGTGKAARWEATKKDNHLWDTEVQNLVLATMLSLVNAPEAYIEETEEAEAS